MAIDKKRYGSKYQDHVLEQYRIYVGGADKISDRRAAANQNYIALTSSIIVAGGIVVQYVDDNKRAFIVGLSILGVAVSIIFWILINSYKQINTAKFEIIHKLEEELPKSLYDDEWIQLGEGKDMSKYLPFSHVERHIPALFGLVYLSIIILIACGR